MLVSNWICPFPLGVGSRGYARQAAHAARSVGRRGGRHQRRAARPPGAEWRSFCAPPQRPGRPVCKSERACRFCGLGQTFTRRADPRRDAPGSHELVRAPRPDMTPSRGRTEAEVAARGPQPDACVSGDLTHRVSAQQRSAHTLDQERRTLDLCRGHRLRSRRTGSRALGESSAATADLVPAHLGP